VCINVEESDAEIEEEDPETSRFTGKNTKRKSNVPHPPDQPKYADSGNNHEIFCI
jgi:hypothetical protein